MSVVQSQLVQRLPFQGEADPALPIGVWGFSLQATGDASGNVLATTAILASISQSKSGSMFSLEHFNMQTNTVGSELARMEIIGAAPPWDITPDYLVDISNTHSTGALNVRSLLALPIFLGWQDRQATALSIGFSMENILNTVLTTMAIGYIWSPRSRSVPGGPKRPQGSIFGN